MSNTSQKHRNFVSEPMGGKLVTELPGVDDILGNRLSNLGYSRASNVYGKYLTMHCDPGRFQRWMKDSCGANSKQARDCHQALKEYCDQFM